MDDWTVLYDNTEDTQTRYIGYAGSFSRLDVVVTTTSNFFGKSLVTVIQNGRTAILGEEDVSNPEYLQQAFALQNSEEALEFSHFLCQTL